MRDCALCPIDSASLLLPSFTFMDFTLSPVNSPRLLFALLFYAQPGLFPFRICFFIGTLSFAFRITCPVSDIFLCFCKLLYIFLLFLLSVLFYNFIWLFLPPFRCLYKERLYYPPQFVHLSRLRLRCDSHLRIYHLHFYFVSSFYYPWCELLHFTFVCGMYDLLSFPS